MLFARHPVSWIERSEDPQPTNVMTSPLHEEPLIQVDSVDSTQRLAGELLRQGEFVGGVIALEQAEGRGRFGRKWHSPPGECLALSLVFKNYIGHPKPYLIGMSLALAAARAFKSQVQWPNDIVARGRKLGGILTEMMPDHKERLVPVVGVGINLGQQSFPEDIAESATSVILEHGLEVEPIYALELLIHQFESLREAQAWADLSKWWERFDATPGKVYTLQDGRQGVAKGIGTEGELICTIDGNEERVLAADAILTPA
jgi:BirA family transcriptional regulator, biotin operon repressor / biotin---[acetyl-CoA-carboxylase] ligase